MLEGSELLSHLSRVRLLELAEKLALSGLSARKKDEIVAALAAKPLEAILGLLKRDELKALCLGFDLDGSGREKDALPPCQDRCRLSLRAFELKPEGPKVKLNDPLF